jgi:hypothetical protein
VRILDTYVAARTARAAIERLLEVNLWPQDRALVLAIDRLLLIEQQASRAIQQVAQWRRSA